MRLTIWITVAAILFIVSAIIKFLHAEKIIKKKAWVISAIIFEGIVIYLVVNQVQLLQQKNLQISEQSFTQQLAAKPVVNFSIHKQSLEIPNSHIILTVKNLGVTNIEDINGYLIQYSYNPETLDLDSVKQYSSRGKIDENDLNNGVLKTGQSFDLDLNKYLEFSYMDNKPNESAGLLYGIRITFRNGLNKENYIKYKLVPGFMVIPASYGNLEDMIDDRVSVAGPIDLVNGKDRFTVYTAAIIQDMASKFGDNIENLYGN